MNRIIAIFLFLIIGVVSLVICREVEAVAITTISFPSEITSLDQFQVTASISGATNATNYLRIDLYKEGTSNYFGETFNGTDWFAGSDGKNYFPIEIQNSSASATLQGRLGSPSNTDYPGPGAYKLKIRRYTASGNSSSSDSQVPVDVQISFVFPTPTPDPTPAPRVTPTPNPTPIKTPTSIPAKTSIQKASPTSNIEIATEILGEATAEPTPEIVATPSQKIESASQSKFPFVAIGLIILGLAFVGVSCFIAFRERLR